MCKTVFGLAQYRKHGEIDRFKSIIAHILFTTFAKIISLIAKESVARIISQHANDKTNRNLTVSDRLWSRFSLLQFDSTHLSTYVHDKNKRKVPASIRNEMPNRRELSKYYLPS